MAADDPVDWRNRGAVSLVKDQGSQCKQAGYAFAAVGALEGSWFLKTGNLISFSEQQLIDCSSTQGNQACNGGLVDFAFDYIEQGSHVCNESAYSYSGKSESCTASTCDQIGYIASFKDVPVQDIDQLKSAIAQTPTAVSVDASTPAFRGYKSGVITEKCGTNAQHPVLAIGYGVDDASSQPYFLLKNSWGAEWGDSGYVRVGQNNTCGVLSAASYPTN